MNLRAGAGCAELHFPEQYFPREGFSGEYDPVSVRTLLLEGEDAVAIVSFELPSIRPFSLTKPLQKMVAEWVGVEEEHVWICMTHNLSAPHVPDKENDPEGYSMHMDLVCQALHVSCHRAKENMQEARLGIGVGTADVNSNRDIETTEGWALGVNRALPSDKTLTIFRFDGLDGNPIAILYHYAMKNCTLELATMEDGMRLSTAELTGKASAYVEQKLNCPALFLMGAGGDQVPRKRAYYVEVGSDGKPIQRNEGPRGLTYLEELGKQLGKQIVEITHTINCSNGQNILRTGCIEFSFCGQQSYQENGPFDPTLSYDYIPATEELLKVQILTVGSITLLGIQPEVTSVIGEKLRQRTNGAALLCTMVNGGKGYMADISAYDRMTYSGTHSVFARGSAERFVSLAEDVVKGLHS